MPPRRSKESISESPQKTPATRKSSRLAATTTAIAHDLDLDGDFDTDLSSSGSGMSTNPALEQRRNLAKLSGATKHTSDVIRDSKFSLDQEVPPTPIGPESGSDKGFFELSIKDRNNFLLLVLLYFLQGIPLGLAYGSVPFLLKRHLSYGQIGIYTLATYPFSMKLLWSPIVDAIWTPRLGRRLSWIIPVQAISGMGMLFLGSHIEEMMLHAGDDGGSGVWKITLAWFVVVFMSATQDIAVDGWAITLLAPDNLLYASSAQTVGVTAGHFLSYTVFLALSSKHFANNWIRAVPSEVGLVTLGGYLRFWGWAYLIVTAGLTLFKTEERTKTREGVAKVYSSMAAVLKLKNIQTIVMIHCIAKIGFMANEAVTNLKLLEKGFRQEDLALTALIDFPIEICLGYLAGRWCDRTGAIPLWCWAFLGRLAAAGLAQFVVVMYPTGQALGVGYFGLIIVEHVFSTFMGTVMFVAISAFHAKIADPVIGGTYMTLLATVCNLGGTFPKIFILKLVDMFTVATCHPAKSAPLDHKHPLVTVPFSCVLESERHRCVDGGGTCSISTDGFYIVNVLCIIFGLVTFFAYIKPAALKLGELPMRAWRVQTPGYPQ